MRWYCPHTYTHWHAHTHTHTQTPCKVRTGGSSVYTFMYHHTGFFAYRWASFVGLISHIWVSFGSLTSHVSISFAGLISRVWVSFVGLFLFIPDHKYIITWGCSCIHGSILFLSFHVHGSLVYVSFLISCSWVSCVGLISHAWASIYRSFHIYLRSQLHGHTEFWVYR